VSQLSVFSVFFENDKPVLRQFFSGIRRKHLSVHYNLHGKTLHLAFKQKRKKLNLRRKTTLTGDRCNFWTYCRLL